MTFARLKVGLLVVCMVGIVGCLGGDEPDPGSNSAASAGRGVIIPFGAAGGTGGGTVPAPDLSSAGHGVIIPFGATGGAGGAGGARGQVVPTPDCSSCAGRGVIIPF
jgi:hypothetical protein